VKEKHMKMFFSLYEPDLLEFQSEFKSYKNVLL